MSEQAKKASAHGRTEQAVLDRLRTYKRLIARIKILERHPVGNGMYLKSIHQDDHLQDLHRQLRGLPSYMYLNKREQQIETMAHAYLTKRPTGTRSQLQEVRQIQAVDAEDERLRRELVGKIEHVIEARSGARAGFDEVIDRISELQDLEKKKQQIEWALDVMEEYKPDYGRLLRLEFVQDKTPAAIMYELGISRSTLYAWRQKALEEYAAITGMTEMD
ncbi:DUF1492 domain-containing protein [Paenibacillus glycinis]|uniref:DUF1492 domain-containing protein n=1 Tax=Paenibacillus glycinis TaxID=2697035 RepID=A0ABW9XPH6_9BACL|nr:DUF1492 domain-containing protein [Paenibacillus glycinis]NBD24326.1 DUF1492 domain-containing protein [Paenibacillus glycinis]